MPHTLKERFSAWALAHPRLFMLMLAAIFMLPAAIFGPFKGDFAGHATWTQEFAHEFWHGHLYPRWLSRMNSGCGDPAFFFYYPLPYYAALPFSFTDIDGQGWYPLVCAMLTLQALMGICCHLWLSSFIRNRTACLFGAVFYMFSPQYILLFNNTYYSSFAFYPLVPLLLYFARKLALGDKRAIIWYAFALAGLYASSIVTAITVAPLPVCYYLFLIRKEKKPFLPAIARLLPALILGTALAAIYLYPLIELRPYTQAYTKGDVTSKALYFANNFLFSIKAWSQFGSAQYVPYYTVLSMIMTYTALIICWLCTKLLRDKTLTDTHEAKFWLAIALFTFFLMLQPSLPVWNIFAFVLKWLQFPWRFGSNILPAALAFAVASYLAVHTARKTRSSFGFVLAAFVVPAMIFIPYAGQHSMIEPLGITKEQALKNSQSYTMYVAYQYYHEKRILGDEFFPAAVPERLHDERNIDELASLCARKIFVADGEATVEATQWESRYIELHVHAKKDSTLEISQFSFPGWAARDNTNPSQEYPISASPENGLIRIRVPAGEHTIRLRLETLPSERNGTIISAITLCILIAMLLYYRKQGKDDESKQAT